MKKEVLKSIICFICVLLVIIVFPCVSSAEEQNALESYENVYSSKEFLEAESYIDYDILSEYDESFAEEQKSGAFKLKKNTNGSITTINLIPYKLYSLDCDYFNNFTGSQEEIDWILKQDFYWIVPTESGNKLRLAWIDDKWEMWDYSTVSGVSDIIDMEQIERLVSVDENIDTNQHENVFCFEIPDYHTSFLSYKKENNVYLIPYGTRPDLTGLANGQIYDLATVKDILSMNFADIDNDGWNNAGIVNSNAAKSTNGYIIIIIILCLLCVATMLYFIIRKIRKNIFERTHSKD